jgi:hypothetical protein
MPQGLQHPGNLAPFTADDSGEIAHRTIDASTFCAVDVILSCDPSRSCAVITTLPSQFQPDVADPHTSVALTATECLGGQVLA